MARCLLALGGNLGQVSSTFRHALRRLNDSCCAVQAVSRFYQTTAVGAEAMAPFLNAAARIDTALAPIELLDRLQAIEYEFGRTRDVCWGPRTLDLDLLFYGDDVLETPRLSLPHPACWYRRFVLDPLVDIAPEFVHPIKLTTIRMLRDRLIPRPLIAAWSGTRGVREVVRRLAPEFPQVQFAEWRSDTDCTTAADPAFIFWQFRELPAETSPEFDNDFLSLPRLPRIAVPSAGHAAEGFLRGVLQSALGEPIAIPDGENPTGPQRES
jgi:2-amino-4-hydroxy-6-hydroxymethyldihydropteridine diphosphokinase